MSVEPRKKHGQGPISVLFTVPWGERRGGAETMLWTFFRHADRSRIEPVVVFLQRGSFEREVAALGIRTRVLDAGRLREMWKTAHTIHRLAEIFRCEQPDLIVNWIGKAQLYGSLAGLFAGMTDRVIWWQHGIPSAHWIDRVATGLPARAVGCSSAWSARAQARLRPKRQTFVVHPGIDSPRPIGPEEVRVRRRNLGATNTANVIGMLGRLQPDKRHDAFLYALQALLSRGHDVHGVIVGGNAEQLSPGYEAYLQSLTETLGLTGRVTFAGHVGDSASYVMVMDVLVHPSTSESFGIGLLEAMALGIPIVAIGRGGPSEIVDANRSGVLLSEPHPEQIEVAVSGLLKDVDLRRRLGDAGRERFRTRFTADNMARGLEDAFEGLVQQ